MSAVTIRLLQTLRCAADIELRRVFLIEFILPSVVAMKSIFISLLWGISMVTLLFGVNGDYLLKNTTTKHVQTSDSSIPMWAYGSKETGFLPGEEICVVDVERDEGTASKEYIFRSLLTRVPPKVGYSVMFTLLRDDLADTKGQNGLHPVLVGLPGKEARKRYIQYRIFYPCDYPEASRSAFGTLQDNPAMVRTMMTGSGDYGCRCFKDAFVFWYAKSDINRFESINITGFELSPIVYTLNTPNLGMDKLSLSGAPSEACMDLLNTTRCMRDGGVGCAASSASTGVHPIISDPLDNDGLRSTGTGVGVNNFVTWCSGCVLIALTFISNTITV